MRHWDSKLFLYLWSMLSSQGSFSWYTKYCYTIVNGSLVEFANSHILYVLYRIITLKMMSYNYWQIPILFFSSHLDKLGF
jgi:hypothetical protein